MSRNTTTTLTAHCLCKTSLFNATIPTSQLPLQATLCHCKSCRHMTGAMYASAILWPTPRSQTDISKLKRFEHFPTIHVLFCPICFTPIFFDEADGLHLFAGTLENFDAGGEEVVSIRRHIFVQDTRDGGASVWLRKNGDKAHVKRYMLRDDGEEVPEAWPAQSDLLSDTSPKKDALPIRCKCHGVNLRLRLPDYSNTPKENLPDNIDPATKKFITDFCACDSCRLASGTDVMNWAFAKLKNISFADADDDNLNSFPHTVSALKSLIHAQDARLGTLAYYTSSPRVQRYSCSTCSATIFYVSENKPSRVDVAVGVLGAKPDGARAVRLLKWKLENQVSWKDDVKGSWREALVERIEGEKGRFGGNQM